MKAWLFAILAITIGLVAAFFVNWCGYYKNILTADDDPLKNDSNQLKLAPNYGELPLYFELNVGQTNERVKFLSRGNGYSFFLTDGEAILAFQKPSGEGREMQSGALRMKFTGANASPVIKGEKLLEGKTNYFVGSNPDKWKTGIANFERVRYANIYDGVDVIYYGTGQHIEHDLVIAPKAAPAQVKYSFNGPEHLIIADNGDIVFKFGENELRQRKPIAYQEINGGRIDVAIDYRIENPESTIEDRQVGFVIGQYDDSQPLIIDPVLSYSTYLGGGSDTFGTSIAVDASGSVYVTGYTAALDFPLAGAFQSINNGGAAGFITKLNAAGTAFVYSTYIGGNSNTFPSSIKLDAAGSAYIGGWTLSSNFPTTSGAYRTLPPGGGRPSFITKLSPSGSSLSYSTYFAGVLDLTGLALDSSGNAYVTGYTQDAFFPTTPGAYKTTLGDGISQNAFVTKFNATGSSLVYSTFVGAAVPFGGGQAIDQANAIAVDTSGKAYITGITISNNYPVTSGAFQTFPGGRRDAFVTKLNASGSALVYSTYLGGGGQDAGRGISVDSSGNAYVTGSFENDDFPFTSGGFLPSGGGGSFGLAFLTKVNPTGTGLIYSTALGFRAAMSGNGITVANDGSAYVIGSEGGGPGAYVINAIQSATRSNDAFIVKMNPAGTGLTYSTPLGGTGIGNRSTVGTAIAIDTTGNAYFTGQTTESDFPVTAGAAQATKPGGGSNSVFISRIGIQPGDCPAIEISPQPLPVAVSNQTYNQQLTATGGVAPFTYSLAPTFSNNVLPVGLMLAPNGTISGTPTNRNFGTYLVTVQVSDSNGCIGIRTLKFDYAIRAPRTSGIYLKVVSRPIIRIGNEYTSFITYANRSTTDLLNVAILIRAPDYVSLRLGSAQAARTFTQSGFNYVSVILPRIRATGDDSFLQTLPVVIRVSDPNRNNQTFALEAAIPRFSGDAPAATPPQSTLNESIFLSRPKTARLTSPSGDCNIFDDNSCDPYEDPNTPCDRDENCSGYFDIGLGPCGGNSDCGVPLIPPLDVNYDRVRIRSGGSVDPNDKTGSPGSGVEQYYTGDVVLPYSVTFENLATATLPAQDVVVTDQLDPNLFDLSTFSFNLIAFGDKQVSPVNDAGQFTTDVDLRPARNSIVRVNGNFNANTGLITWRFNTLDPNTGLPPDDPMAGFLPPNRTSPEGQGTLLFTVKAKSGLATGTQIRNKARIVFDANAPIDTPDWLNTIDNAKPTSRVQALPSIVPLNFNLAWSGTDVGAGISTYTIYVSQDGGPFVPYLINTTAMSTVVNTLTTNHTFRFYSIATDAASNVEPPKTTAEATSITDASIRLAVSGRVLTPGGLGLRNSVVSLIDASGVRRTATTSSFGLYAFDNLASGQTFTLTVASKRYRFSPRVMVVTGNLTNVDFVGLE